MILLIPERKIRFENILYILFSFYTLLGLFFYDTFSFLSSMDEFIVLLLMVMYLVFKKDLKISGGLLIYSIITLFYIVYSMRLGIAPKRGVLADVLVVNKSFIVYFIIRDLKITLPMVLKKRLVGLIRALLVLVALLSLGGHDILEKLFFHLSRHASLVTLLSMTLLFCLPFSLKNFTASVFFLSFGLIGLKGKFIAFYFIFVALGFLLIIINNYRKKINLLGLVFLLSILFLFILLLVREKIVFYFITGTEDTENMFARPALYLNSFIIAGDYFPFGTGFSSYASYYSGVYYSPLYEEYGLSQIHGLTQDEPMFIADAGFPMILGQFGYAGLGFFLLFICIIMKKATVMKKKTIMNTRNFFLVIMIIFYLIVELFVDSSLTQNRGVFALYLLALIMNEMEVVSREYTAVK